ncbi:MAG TPA: neutral/alkaline non-lysosomal ceramidase N-terminal domain-containing protein [Chloroflexota bacterium]|nr:neutral/alkaline non-lysosomal ceramidase N-terminal domain-containing protein [Chloroflexota bacterium]
MRAGVAKVCITPPVGTWQGGYGARTKPCQGVHDDLYARALVVESDGDSGGATTKAAIVSVDIVGLTHEVAEGAKRRAEELTGIPGERIAFCTSHTHGGPVLRAFLGRTEGPQVDEQYARILEKYLAGAVAAAAQELRPVAVRLGRGEAGFNVNRRLKTAEGIAMRSNPEGVVDREVVVIRVDELSKGAGEERPDGPSQPSQPPLAVLFRYTCHATAMGANNYLITADYPGAAARTIEQAYGGETTAIFLQGCAGNIRPNLTSAQGGFRSADWDELARLGRELGGAAVAAAEQAAFVEPAGKGDLAAAGTVTTLPYAPPPPAEELRTLAAGGKWPNGQALTATERQWAGNALKVVEEGGGEEGVPAEVQVFRLGDVYLVTLPGEVFVEIGWKVRDAVAKEVGVGPERVVVAAYANGSVGYVPTAAAMPEGGYEVTAYRHAGRPSGYAAEAEDILAGTASRLASGLSSPDANATDYLLSAMFWSWVFRALRPETGSVFWVQSWSRKAAVMVLVRSCDLGWRPSWSCGTAFSMALSATCGRGSAWLLSSSLTVASTLLSSVGMRPTKMPNLEPSVRYRIREKVSSTSLLPLTMPSIIMFMSGVVILARGRGASVNSTVLGVV